mgnify:CR=1 FL=1
MDSVIERVASYVSGLTFESLTPASIGACKLRLTDSIGCALGAYHAGMLAYERAGRHPLANPVAIAVLLYPKVGVELLPQTDEGEVTVTAELPVGTRIERTDAVAKQLEGMVKSVVIREWLDRMLE